MIAENFENEKMMEDNMLDVKTGVDATTQVCFSSLFFPWFIFSISMSLLPSQLLSLSLSLSLSLFFLLQAGGAAGENDEDVNEIVRQSDVYKMLKKQGEIHDEKMAGE